jgi:hypothetical protein
MNTPFYKLILINSYVTNSNYMSYNNKLAEVLSPVNSLLCIIKLKEVILMPNEHL